MTQKKLLVFLFFCALFFINQQKAFACSCAATPTVLDSFESAELVIVAKVVSVEKADETDGYTGYGGVKSTKMVVEKVYKGNVKTGDFLTFGQGGGADCIWTFDEESVGKKILFYLGSASRGRFYESKDENAPLMYYAIACGRSKGFNRAFDDLAYLDNIEKVRGKTRLSGTFESWESFKPSFANLKVKITGAYRTFETRTDANGFYEIYDLPAGEYFVEPQMPKGWKINDFMLNYSPSVQKFDKLKNRITVVVKERRHASLDILFDIDNAIRGRVLSPTGKPMEGVCIRAIPAEADENETRGELDCTNEKGFYEIDELAPGNYVLVINDDGKIDDTEPFGKLFYPGVSERKDAAILSIDAGKFLNNIDIQITKTVELIEIKGTFLYADGKAAAKKWIEFKPLQSDKYDKIREQTDNQGRFTIKIPKGAAGKLSGEVYTYSDEMEKCPNLAGMLKESGKSYMSYQSDEVEISGNENLFDVKLALSFPCAVKTDN